MRRLAILAILAVLPLPAFAWTRATDERIAKKAAALAPPDLRVMIQRFEGDYRRGLALAQAGEGTEAHQYFAASRKGLLRQRIERETRGAVEAIRGRKPMSDVVERLGVLAHLVADANNPFNVSNEDPRLAPMSNDFASYLERGLPKFPTVFYGIDEEFHLERWLDKTFKRSARFYPLLREEYFRDGEKRTSASFDDRSTAFGVASVAYSRSVSDLVNLYYFVWKESGGDVRSAAAMRDGNLLLHAND